MWSLLLPAVLLAAPSPAPARTASVAAPPPRIEVAFVLDTTGSMGGLIEGAKRRIWTIARRIGEGRPRPELAVALVGYRDRGDEYVTRVHDFTGDMDEVYGRLMQFQANGGGDGPEHVTQALRDAVQQLRWSPDRRVVKLVFLVGDAPPHEDYPDGDWRAVLGSARRKGLDVVALQCGADPATERVWREVATLGHGDYVQLDAQGGMTAQVTPQDAELARLNAELARTVVLGGSAPERESARRKLDARAAMAAPAAAEAAPYYAASGRLAEKDLVAMDASEQRQELSKMAAQPAGAPAELRGKTTAQALAELQAKRVEREKLQKRVLDLHKQREAWLAAQAGPQDAFDARVVGFVAKRAAQAGVEYR